MVKGLRKIVASLSTCRDVMPLLTEELDPVSSLLSAIPISKLAKMAQNSWPKATHRESECRNVEQSLLATV